MQRMLVALSLFLLVAVAYLGYSVFELSSRLEAESLARARDTREEERAPAASPEPDLRKIQLLEKRLLDARDENTALKGKVSRLETRVSELHRFVVDATSNAPGGPPSEGPTAVGSPGGLPTEIKRDEQGNFLISQEEMDYIRAVQARIDRQRRIDGQTRNYLRRVDSLVSRGEIAEIPEEKKAELETVLRRFVTRNDDLVTTYVREPSAAVQALDETEKRDQLSAARERFAREARDALRDVLPAGDIGKVAERVFTNPWGLRPRGFNR